MNSYFIFYDVIREAPEFEYDRSSEVTYAKIKMSLYKTEDKKHIKIAIKKSPLFSCMPIFSGVLGVFLGSAYRLCMGL